MDQTTTIAAIATAAGVGAIAVIRLSGPQAIGIADRVYRPAAGGLALAGAPARSVQLGHLVDGRRLVDQVVVTLFRAPRSYTGQDLVEIACHGSPIIQQQALELLIRNGAVLAQPGEFTLRAFLNGKMDLSQAEAVADLIASGSESARRIALDQMRGGFSHALGALRERLLALAALVELELDFSEEDVEFADRAQLVALVREIMGHIDPLIGSFAMGNAIKEGIPVAIVGRPNVGKSTLLNRLLNEERAIVSEIPGTTRDTIEDTISIQGLSFRFVDTAGLREAQDPIERLGLERTRNALAQALVVLTVISGLDSPSAAMAQAQAIAQGLKPHQRPILIISQDDLPPPAQLAALRDALRSQFPATPIIPLSAKLGRNMEALTSALVALARDQMPQPEGGMVSSARHYQALLHAQESLRRVEEGLSAHITPDLLSPDIRLALHHLGEITGQITTDEVLGAIFSKFCVGK